MRKRIISFVGIMAFIVAFSAIASYASTCHLNGKQVCFNIETQRFETEKQGQLTIFLQNNEQRDYLLSQIRDQIYQQQLRLIIRTVDEITAWDAVMENNVDIFYIQKDQAAMIVDQLMPISEVIVDQLFLEGLDHFLSVINDRNFVFIPYTYSGSLFVYNKTLLTQLGIDVETVDKLNRPVELSDWTQIMELSNQYYSKVPTINRKPLQALFPLTIDEPWQFYPFLTAGGWQMFENFDASKPTFLSTDFFHSLLFIEKLGQVNWDLTKTKNYSWRYEKTLLTNTAPLGIETEWMNLASYAQRTNQEFIYTAYPTYNNKQLTPLVNIKGLVAKKNKYPSLTNEIIRILTQFDAMQLMLDSSEEALVIPVSMLDQFEIDPIKKQKSLAYAYSVSEPLVALPNNPSIRGWDFYLQGNHVDVIKQVFDQTLSPTEAQLILIERYQEWLEIYNQSID